MGIVRALDFDQAFQQLVAGLDYPMFVVTATAGERSGCLVGFASQASIDPPRFAVLLSKANHTFRVAARADALAVHFLRRDDRALAVLFGEESGDRDDKFLQLCLGERTVRYHRAVRHEELDRRRDRRPARRR